MNDLKKFLNGRESTRDALIKRFEKADKKGRTEKRNNKSPEKDVEKLVMDWLLNHNFSCHVVESKAVYSASVGRYLRGQTTPGFPDVVGCDRNGVSVWIELKAPGRRNTVSDKQSVFLSDKIAKGCFAVCVDSTDLLEHFWNEWTRCKLNGLDRQAVMFLEESLPKKRKNRAKDDEGLGF